MKSEHPRHKWAHQSILSLTLLSFRWSKEPSHNSSDLDWFIFRPEQFWESYKMPKSSFNELTSFTKNSCVISILRVLSILWFGSLWTPFIRSELLIARVKISTLMVNNMLDRVHTCITPLFKLKCLVAQPLFRKQLISLLYQNPLSQLLAELWKFLNNLADTPIQQRRKLTAKSVVSIYIRPLI